MTPTLPARDRSAVPARDMTASEILMARVVACCPALKHSKYRGAMRLLHAQSLSANRVITPADAATLRACVLAFKGHISPHIVELASPKPLARVTR